MKIQFEAINHSYGKDIFYGAVSLCGGAVTKNYVSEDKQSFTGNYAFHFVLFEYLRDSFEEDAFRYYVDRAVSVIAFSRDQEHLIPTMNALFERLFRYDCSAGEFEQAKESAKRRFTVHYKDEKFRALYKAYEFSDMRKRFMLKNLLADFEQLDFETFANCAKTLVTAGNTCVVISGEAEKIEWEGLNADLPGISVEKRVYPAGYSYDPYLRQDAHIVHIARRECMTEVLAFDFMDNDTPVFVRRLIIDMLAAQIPESEKYLWADPLDASIIFHTEEFRRYKELITIPDEKLFGQSKRRVLFMYMNAAENHPELFNITAASLLQWGIYMDAYIGFLESCQAETFDQLCRKADFKISEAQILLRRESNHVRNISGS